MSIGRRTYGTPVKYSFVIRSSPKSMAGFTQTPRPYKQIIHVHGLIKH